MHVNDLLKIAVESGASDLHLKVGSYPMMRLRGTLTPASDPQPPTSEMFIGSWLRRLVGTAGGWLPPGTPR